jgi:hypothetical protein
MDTFNETGWLKYRAKNKELRFWQALRNFCKVNYIWYQERGGFEENKSHLLIDTFYIKDK